MNEEWPDHTERDDDSAERVRHARAREELRRRLADVRARDSSQTRVWKPIVAGLALFAFVASSVSWWQAARGAADRQAPSASDLWNEHGARPIAAFTPGAARDVPIGELCAAMPVEPQTVAGPVRDQVLRDYGMEAVPAHEYELDYLITPDLGGTPDRRNLWPERYGSLVWNARVKDELEDLLARMVCEGQIDLVTAQQEIARDWIAAYRKYFRTDRPVRLQSAMLVSPADRP
jgi:hypothetical protein